VVVMMIKHEAERDAVSVNDDHSKAVSNSITSKIDSA
jgi:hypothetical protein